LRQALAIYRKVFGEEHPNTADAYNNLAASQTAQGQYTQAEEGLRKALAIYRKTLGEEHPSTATCHNNLAGTLKVLGKYAEAEDGYRQALAIRRKVLGEKHPDTASSYNNLASLQLAQGKYAQAEEGFTRALAIFRQILGAEHPHTATCCNNLAASQRDQGKYQQAERGFRQALTIYRKVLGENHPDTATGYHNVAMSLQSQGKYAEAEAGYKKALAICRKLLGDEHPLTAQDYNDLASTHRDQGKYAQAEEGYRKALVIRRKVLGAEHPSTATSYNNLALSQQLQGKYADAEAGFRKSLALCRMRLGEDHPDTAGCYHNVALSQEVQGQYKEAEDSFRKALAIWRKVLGEEHPNTAQGYNSLAINQQAQGKYRQAEEGHRQALAIWRKVLGEEHPDTAISYNNLAANLSAQGRYKEAEQLWTQAAQVFARARLRLEASGLQRAARTSERSPLPALAAVLARNGKTEEAWQRFEESLARGTWDELSTRLRRPPAEQAKQAQLVRGLERLDQLVEKTFAAKQASELLKKRRQELLTQRLLAQDELDAFALQLEKTYGPAAGQVFPCQQIQVALPADTALLGWLDIAGRKQAADPSGEHWAVLLRARGAPVWVRLPGSGSAGAWTEDDTTLPARLQKALLSPQGKWQPLAQRLQEQRLAPLHSHLGGVRHLVVLPSPALAGVPVEVFADGYTVSYALSGTLHTHLGKQPRPAGKELLVVADPVFEAQAGKQPDTDSWPELPGTRTEAQALMGLFGARARQLAGSSASEQQLQQLAGTGELGKYRYVHLAAHGDVDNRLPLRSAVILARDALPDAGKQLDAGLPIFDGRLTAEEVLRQWHLDSDLVTLSACQTALGKYESGEGFVGFAQALILAGSRSVCLSLWKVDDAATALLMQRFYQNLLGKRPGLKGPMAKAAALAEAKNWLRGLSREEATERVAQLNAGVPRSKGRKLQLLPASPASTDATERPFAHPYYWAAFVLIGQAE
jgi:CHAT domain-containing protein/Tfp pilus assembly protein PilF